MPVGDTSRGARRHTGTSEHEIECALPFLLLGPLRDAGYLDAVAVAAGMTASAAPGTGRPEVVAEQFVTMFAAAFARAILVPAGRIRDRRRGGKLVELDARPARSGSAGSAGFIRRPTPSIFGGVDVELAVFLAGTPPTPAAIAHAFARPPGGADPPWALPDGVLAAAMAAGHRPGAPLLMMAVPERLGGGLLLADADGPTPIAWAGHGSSPGDGLAGPLRVWHGAGRPVLLADSSFDPIVLAELSMAGVGFVVGLPPGRYDRWRRIGAGGPANGLWTNMAAGPPGTARGVRESVRSVPRAQDSELVGVLAVAAELAAHSERLTTLLAEIGGALPGGPGAPFGRSVLLAVAASLSTLAYRLWGDGRPTENLRSPPTEPDLPPGGQADPLLALERFADLSARVRIDDRQVLVRLPLGRRHADLLGCGLLADVPGVPWLAGRVVRLEGG